MSGWVNTLNLRRQRTYDAGLGWPARIAILCGLLVLFRLETYFDRVEFLSLVVLIGLLIHAVFFYSRVPVLILLFTQLASIPILYFGAQCHLALLFSLFTWSTLTWHYINDTIAHELNLLGPVVIRRVCIISTLVMLGAGCVSLIALAEAWASLYPPPPPPDVLFVCNTIPDEVLALCGDILFPLGLAARISLAYCLKASPSASLLSAISSATFTLSVAATTAFACWYFGVVLDGVFWPNFWWFDFNQLQRWSQMSPTNF